MTRITVEDCLKNVGNRFELVLVASKRARQIAMSGFAQMIGSSMNDKAVVIALREIAEGKLEKKNIDECNVLSRDPIVCNGK